MIRDSLRRLDTASREVRRRRDLSAIARARALAPRSYMHAPRARTPAAPRARPAPATRSRITNRDANSPALTNTSPSDASPLEPIVDLAPPLTPRRRCTRPPTPRPRADRPTATAPSRTGCATSYPRGCSTRTPPAGPPHPSFLRPHRRAYPHQSDPRCAAVAIRRPLRLRRVRPGDQGRPAHTRPGGREDQLGAGDRHAALRRLPRDLWDYLHVRRRARGRGRARAGPLGHARSKACSRPANWSAACSSTTIPAAAA